MNPAFRPSSTARATLQEEMPPNSNLTKKMALSSALLSRQMAEFS
jgi:hypothetical protein